MQVSAGDILFTSWASWILSSEETAVEQGSDRFVKTAIKLDEHWNESECFNLVKAEEILKRGVSWEVVVS